MKVTNIDENTQVDYLIIMKMYKNTSKIDNIYKIKVIKINNKKKIELLKIKSL